MTDRENSWPRWLTHDETILELNPDPIEFYLARQQNMMADANWKQQKFFV